MDIVKAIREAEKIPTEVFEALSERLGNGDDWKEESNKRGYAIITVKEESTQIAWAGDLEQQYFATKALSQSFKDKMMAVINDNDFVSIVMGEEDFDMGDLN